MNVYWNHTLVLLLALFSPLLSPTLLRADVLDADINFHVTDSLLTDSRVSASAITATTTDGVVTLSGNVDNLAAKSFAVAEAKKINGVLGVIDKITVTPEFRWDNDIANSVRRRLLNSSVIKSQGLIVTCQNGVVTLEGTVDSYSEEQQAGLLASEVDGVKQVNNNILSTWSTTRSDSEIKNDAVAALARDVYLNGLPITVSVQDGNVSLSGSVGNANEKDRAYEDVRWIANVTSVNNALTVEWYEPQDVKTDNQAPSDDAIEQAVRSTLDQDSRLDANKITLRVSSGTVTLDGSVSSVYERRLAEQDTRNVMSVHENDVNEDS